MASSVHKAGVAVGGIAVVAVGLWVAVGVVSVAGVETPKFTLVEQHEGYEIRRYDPQLVAEVTVDGEYNEALNQGFRILADYIFGANAVSDSSEGASANIEMTALVQERKSTSVKIEMTAPVTEVATDDNSHVISFIMPSEYTRQTLPEPLNEVIRIVEIPTRTYAVLQFSGTVGEEDAKTKKETLEQMVARDGMKTEGEPILCQYNPPWTPPPMRRNEIWLRVNVDDEPL